MNSLNELIGQVVYAIIGHDDEVQLVKCRVINVEINDYYFQEKNESIYITVNVDPLEDIPDGFDYDDFHDVSLNCITSCNQ